MATFILSFRVFVKRIYRSFAAPSLRRFPFPPLSPKSHGINLFADPHPLTLLESYLFKNCAGRGYSRRSDIRKLQRADVLCPVKSFPCHSSGNSPLSPAIGTDPKTHLSKSCICHTSETPPGGKPPVASHYHFHNSPACPDLVGLTSLPNSLPVPRECIGRTIGAGGSFRQATRVTVPSFPNAFHCVGGCDG